MARVRQARAVWEGKFIMAAAAAAAGIARIRRRIIRTLRELGAISPASAAPLPQQRTGGRILAGLIRRGVVVDVGQGRLYLDEARLVEVDAARRQRATIALTVLAVLAIVILLALFLTVPRS